MSSPGPDSGRLITVLSILVAVALITNAILVTLVYDLRSDVEALRGGAGAGVVSRRDLRQEIGRLEERLNRRNEDLKRCFNRALLNSFKDFSRYALGTLPPPRDIAQVVETCAALAGATAVRPYARGLNFPVDLAWLPGTDTILFTEKRTGNIRVLEGKKLLRTPCATLDVNFAGSRGTLGLVLDPNFAANKRLYVYYTNASPLEQRVARFTFEDNRCTDKTDIITGIPADPSSGHNGGQLEFVGDKLFVSTGDGYSDPDRAQDLDNLLGKVLRYNRDGSIPDDNPYSKPGAPSPVWAFGLRNPFGLAYDASAEKLYATDNGPNCDDELELVVERGNYGSGTDYKCGTLGLGPDPEPALLTWSPPIVPTDIWFYDGAIEDLAGDLYMGDFGAGRLHRIVLTDAGTKVLRDEIIYDSPTQIVDVTEGPKGLLYFATPTAILRVLG